MSMNRRTSEIPTRPARTVWTRNWLPRVALRVSLESAVIGNGNEPNLRIVTRFPASLALKPASPPPVIWTFPFGIAFWMTGADTTAPSRVIAK